MSRDFLSSRVRSNALIGSNGGSEPSLVLYPSSQASNNIGGRSAALQNFLGTTNNYPSNTFLFVFGAPTTSAAGSGINPGDSSTVFGGDILVKGTLFTDYLRTTSGVLIDFAGIAYVPPSGTNYLTSSPSTAPAADVLLDAEIKTNRDDITTNTGNITGLTTLSNLHEASIGLETDGTFSANVSTNYIALATSLRNESFLLDAQIELNTEDGRGHFALNMEDPNTGSGDGTNNQDLWSMNRLRVIYYNDYVNDSYPEQNWAWSYTRMNF